MSKNYYEEILEQINILIKDKNFKEAYELINEELKMPYVPEIYEVQFINIINDIKHEVVGDNASTTVTRDVAMDYLLSEDGNQEALALELLRDHNLRHDIELIKKRLETWPIEKNILKAYLFELLVEQEIDVDINFNGILMNPKTNGSILENDEVKMAMQVMPTLFEKNPSAESMAMDELQRFLLITYPAVPENGREFAANIAQVVKSMFEEIDLTETQKLMKKYLNNTKESLN